MKRSKPVSINNLPVQVVVTLLLLVILTAAAIGIPTIWLIRDRLEQQAWSLVKQGNRTTHVLLDARWGELTNLAILTAGRPTLAQLLVSNDLVNLLAYLETLRSGAGLDLVAVCDLNGETIAQAGSPSPAQACKEGGKGGVYRSQTESGPTGWLLASQPILGEPYGTVMVGLALDNEFISQLEEQTGSEQLFLLDGQLLASSFPDSAIAWGEIAPQVSEPVGVVEGANLDEEFTLGDMHYFATRSRYGDTGLETIVSWPVSEITETQQRLTWMVAGGIAFIILLCSALGIVFAKRISLPLERLRDSAITLRKGDLERPVVVQTRVQEVAQVAFALEDARIALEHTLTELRQEKAWVDQLLGSVVEGIITLDRGWRITFFSQGAERISGWKQEQALGKSIDAIFRLEGGNERFSQRIQSAGEKQEIVTVCVNNRPVVLAITGAKLAPPEAGKAQMALVLRDVSNEQAIRRLLGDFLANITHEFRTPLSALAASIELLLDQLPELSQADLNELLTSLHLGILGLQTLIDNLLEAASIEAGRFRVVPQTAELVDVIDGAVHTMQPLLQKYNLRLQVDIPADLPLVKVDSRRTIQVLVNLISNAIKWGPSGTEIYLSATSYEHEVKIIVADQGPGVLPEHKEGLFTRFAHVHTDGNRAEYGAGLGLSVVKAIIEAQGGKVGVEDRVGGGAIFWFTLLTVTPENESEKMST